MSKLELTASLIVIVLGMSLSLSQAQTRGIRVEENDPSINYSGYWVVDTEGVHSAGRAIILNETGARASLTFTGTAINWIGDTSFDRGVAKVYLDGNVNIVDTYSEVRRSQVSLFLAKGLTPGVHTLLIEESAIKNSNASGSGIGIDAFDIEDGALVTGSVVANPGLVEQNSPAVTYTGSWYLNNSSRPSGGSAVLAMDPGSKATVQFNGTGITWIGYMDPYSGYAKVYVDGVQKGMVDTFDMAWGTHGSVDAIWQRTIWGVGDLPAGTHTLTIEVLGQRGSNSTGNWVWVDAFRVTGPGTIAAN